MWMFPPAMRSQLGFGQLQCLPVLLQTRGPVHEFMYQWDFSAWPAGLG